MYPAMTTLYEVLSVSMDVQTNYDAAIYHWK